MKKFITLALAALIALSYSANAQSAAEVNREQTELNKILRKSIETKPSKEAKKQAKALTKQGWQVPMGQRSIEQQIAKSEYLGAELMADETGMPVNRFIMHTAMATAGTYNAAFAAARSNAQVEIASMLEADLAAAMQGKIDNLQSSASQAVSNDRFDQRMKAIVSNSLSNSTVVSTLYKMLPNGNYQVQVQVAYDKKEAAARIKRAMQKELEIDGDNQLNSIVDKAIYKN